MLKLHSLRPSSINKPWRLCVYCDEVRPGNILNSSGRKAWCCHGSFLEFTTMLSKEDFWFTLSIIRTAQASKVSAGMSQIFRLLMEDICSSGIPQTGVLLSSDKGSVRLFLHYQWCFKMVLRAKLFGCVDKMLGPSPACFAQTCFISKVLLMKLRKKYCLSFASTASLSALAMQKLLILGTEWLRDSKCFHRWSSTSGSRPQGYLSVHMAFFQAALCKTMVYCFLPACIAMTICAQCAQMASWLMQCIWSWKLFSVLDTMHGACWANGCHFGCSQSTSKALTLPSSLMHKR